VSTASAERLTTADAARPRNLWRIAVAVVAGAGIVRLILAALLPLFPDETYYWEWGRHLAGGYFDHPPVTAMLIRAGVRLLGFFGLAQTSLAVRFFPVLVGTAGALAIIATARRLGGGGDEGALRAAIFVTVLPLAAAGLVLATPDAPLLGFIAIALYCVVRAVQSPLRSRASLVWWTAAGIALGCAFASKYTSILFPMGVVLAVLLTPELRPRLREPGPYVACIVATMVFSPVLVWNAQHEWISFTYQLRHGLGTPRGSPLNRELELVGGQAGLASPILFVMMVIATARAFRGPRGQRDEARLLLAFVATFVMAFFCASAWRKPVEANWPAPAFIPAIALLGAQTWSTRGWKWLRAGVWLAATLSAIVYVHGVVRILPLVPRRDPIARAYGWDALAASARRTQKAAAGVSGATAWLGADRYQDASEIAFHAVDQPMVFSMNLSGRHNQYDLWPSFPQLARPGENLVLALDESNDMHSTVARLSPYFTDVQRGELVELRRGAGLIGTRRLWVLTGWTGGWPEVSSVLGR
jgi:4-amino-4-deoxy-L-arabinose transferase-like glycosyltransferase